ncbi:DUF5780 domain-containing protein [Gracilibacillus sp. YIM 98692]|uniref:DUF5780 domain-containing protein n=1 Tax=Gracilibacillus sp. YIM 98692 TaxID=2663532 RepID=UPI0013CF832B|nr:DUF5780 domain-containing protein [Gracilibacillus sp. YIM 98692]
MYKHNEDKEKDRSKLIIGKRNILMLLSAMVIIVICSLLFFVYFNDSLRQYKTEIRDNNYSEANRIYEDEIEDNTEEENQAKTFLAEEVSKIKNEFINNEMNYNAAMNRLETIESTELISTDVKHTIDEMNELHDSRISYKKGLEFVDSENYIEAIKEFGKVMEEDENFESAQEQIQEIGDNYKSEAIKQAEKYVSNNKYEEAISLLQDADDVIPDDSDILSKLEVYEGQLEKIRAAERQEEMKNAKDEQIIIVENAKIVEQDPEHKALYPDMVQVMIRNDSDKTIKNFEVGVLGFDNNGYPLKIRGNFDFSGGRYEFVGNAEDVNVVAGDRFGENVGWELDDPHGISQVLACVKSVTFYDGSTWDNPYYEYWIKEYKEKPLE